MTQNYGFPVLSSGISTVILVCLSSNTVADPGFPVAGGRGPRTGGVDSPGGYVSKILYVKTKELGPLGGGRAPPRSANAIYNIRFCACNVVNLL